MADYWARELRRIKNPLFKFEKRPEILDILYKDCMSSFSRDTGAEVDPFKTRYEELADLTKLATPAELISFYVKSVHEKIGTTTDDFIFGKKDKIVDKKFLLNKLNSIAERGSGFIGYSAPPHIEIGEVTLLSKVQK